MKYEQADDDLRCQAKFRRDMVGGIGKTLTDDLMKVVEVDSSLSARKQSATELHYSRPVTDSAAMNVWLHKEVMTKLAENGGKFPQELLS